MLTQPAPRFGIATHSRLIQQKEIQPVQRGPGDLNPPGLTAGELANLAPIQTCDAGFFKFPCGS